MSFGQTATEAMSTTSSRLLLPQKQRPGNIGYPIRCTTSAARVAESCWHTIHRIAESCLHALSHRRIVLAHHPPRASPNRACAPCIPCIAESCLRTILPAHRRIKLAHHPPPGPGAPRIAESCLHTINPAPSTPRCRASLNFAAHR